MFLTIFVLQVFSVQGVLKYTNTKITSADTLDMNVEKFRRENVHTAILPLIEETT